MENKIYEKEFLQVLLENDLYGGDKEYVDLRCIFNDIITSIKHTSYIEDNCQHIVQLTNVDEIFVQRQINLYFEHTKKNVEKYSKDNITSSIIEKINLINDVIRRDFQLIVDTYKMMEQEPKFGCELISVEELKQKLNLG